MKIVFKIQKVLNWGSSEFCEIENVLNFYQRKNKQQHSNSVGHTLKGDDVINQNGLLSDSNRLVFEEFGVKRSFIRNMYYSNSRSNFLAEQE